MDDAPATPPVAGRRPRGRPRRGDVLRHEVSRAVVLAPLLAPSAGWTSHTIAHSTGTSQSTVARVWAQTFAGAPDRLGGLLPATGLRLVAVTASAENSLLVLAGSAEAEVPVDPGPFMRSPRRASLQVLLATDLLVGIRPRIRSAATHPAPTALDCALVEKVRCRLGTAATVYVLTRRPLPTGDPPSGAGPGERPVVQVVLEDALAWQGLLEQLVRRCTGSPASVLRSAELRAMEWARSGVARFDWTGPGINPPPPSVAVPRAGEPPRASAQVLADQVFAVLLDRIATGRLGAGDRLTEASLARAVRTSRSHVRDALRALAGSGLVDLEPHRGARVPVPQIADVVEIYAGRRALGTLVMRRATRWTPGDLDPVDRALADLLDIARTGDRHATGDADLRFQDALAEATGMRRIPPMFAALTAQLRLHIAVMGLNYAYSIAGMCVATTSLSSTTSVPGTRPPRSPPGTPRSTPRSAT